MSPASMSPDPRAVLAQAAQLHRAGRMDAAIEAYRTAARLAPGFLEAHRLLALALLQAGRAKDAVRAARQARDIAPRDPNTHVLVGAGLLLAGEAQKALAAFDDAAKLAPGLIEAQFQAGNALATLGRHAAAAERFTRALEIDPRAPEPRMNRATAYARLGRTAEALADCDVLVEMQPWIALHHVNKGQLLLDTGDFSGAVAAARIAVAAQAGFPGGHFLLGQALLGTGDLPGARAALTEAARLDPKRPGNHVRLAHVARLSGDYDAALAAAEAALALDPRSVAALTERSEIRRMRRDAAGAMADADAAIAIQRAFAPAQLARAAALRDLGRGGDVRGALDRAIRAGGDTPAAIFARAADDLAHGRWAEGWPGYDARERLLPVPFTPLPFTRWDGTGHPEPLVVLGEQGIGDLIHFGRLLPLLAARGIDVRLLTRPRLVPLLAGLDPRVQVITDLSGIDTAAPGLRWAPLASLPGLIAPDPAHWPSAPFLHAEAERAARWAGLGAPGRLTIGINWQGNPSPVIDLGRSAPLAAFAPLAALPEVDLVSLQYGPGIEQLDAVPFAVRRLDGLDADGVFRDTAGVLAHLDLIVTTDTAVAHLAGAMGRPGYVALRAVPEWRWGVSGTDSMLYPSLHLVRQERAGDWGGVFDTIAARIAGLIAARRAGAGEDRA